MPKPTASSEREMDGVEKAATLLIAPVSYTHLTLPTILRV